RRADKEVAIGGFSALPALVHEIVFEAAGVATGPPSGNMSPEPPAYSPSESEEKVLLYLLEMYPRRKKQDDIAAGAELARPTVGIILERLRAHELTHRPEGERRGETLTAAGKQLAETLKRGKRH